MKLGLLFIVILVCVVCFTADAQTPTPYMQPEIVFTRPSKFAGKTNEWTGKISADLNRPVTIGGGYHRAHVISFDSIRKLIADTFLQSHDPQKWKRLAKQLNEDLHTFDTDWFRYNEMTQKNSWQGYEDINKKSKEAIDKEINDIVTNHKLNDNASLKKIIKLMNSAPANLRPGHGPENCGIQGYMDPLKGHTTKNVNLEEKDLTQRSRDLKVNYSLEWKTINNGQFIRSSDIPKV